MAETFARFKLFRMPDHLFGCVYCGAPASTKDHVSPKSLHRFLDSFTEESLDSDIQGALVPACKDCNCILGAHPTWMLGARIKVLKRKLFLRNYKKLSRPIWDEDEIEECGRSLRSAIQVMNREDLNLRARYAFQPPIEFVQDVELHQLGIDMRVKSKLSAAAP